MEKNNCTLTEHKYGLWQIENEKEVSRICEECHYKEILPMTTETLTEIKLQEKAKTTLNKFLTIPNKDNNIIGFIYVILDKIPNYIDRNQKLLLINKLNEIRLEPETTDINNTLLETIIKSIYENKDELLENTIEQFFTYNINAIQFPTVENNSTFSK